MKGKTKSSAREPVRWFASLTATVCCAYLSLGTSEDLCHSWPTIVPAHKALHFEPGRTELTLRVTVDGNPVELLVDDGLVLSSPGFSTGSAGAPSSIGPENAGTVGGTLCGTVDLHSNQSQPEPQQSGPLVPADVVCEFQVTRSDATQPLDTSLTAFPVGIGCGEMPEYSVSIEIVE